MQYIEMSSKSVQKVVDSIINIVGNSDFKILAIHNLKSMLDSNGLYDAQDCQIIDICNAKIANDFLKADMDSAPALPCKFTIYSKDDCTFIVLSSLLQIVNELNPSLLEIAVNAQQKLLNIIREAK